MSRPKLDEILEKSIELFQHKGFTGTSLQDIADAVGMQKPSLYYYINRKEDLLFIILERTADCYIEQLTQIVQSDASSYQKLDLAIQQHILMQMREAGTATLFRSASDLADERYAIIHASIKRYRELLKQIIREGVERGELYVEDPSIAAVMILGACNFVHRWYKPDGPKNIEEIARSYSQMLLSGMSLSYANPNIGPGTY